MSETPAVHGTSKSTHARLANVAVDAASGASMSASALKRDGCCGANGLMSLTLAATRKASATAPLCDCGVIARWRSEATARCCGDSALLWRQPPAGPGVVAGALVGCDSTMGVQPGARQRCPWGTAHDAPGGNLKVSYQALLRHLQVTERAVVGNLEVCR